MVQMSKYYTYTYDLDTHLEAVGESRWSRGVAGRRRRKL